MFITFIIMSLVSVALAQRPGYAGSMPFGYPVMLTTTTASPVTATSAAAAAGVTNGLGDRFGEISTTTQRLPLEANGNVELVNQLLQLPIDQRPFWLINWQILEEHRNQPQTWQIKDNTFLDVGPGLSERSGSGYPYYRSMYMSK